jgi:hypothetical protein
MSVLLANLMKVEIGVSRETENCRLIAGDYPAIPSDRREIEYRLENGVTTKCVFGLRILEQIGSPFRLDGTLLTSPEKPLPMRPGIPPGGQHSAFRPTASPCRCGRTGLQSLAHSSLDQRAVILGPRGPAFRDVRRGVVCPNKVACKSGFYQRLEKVAFFSTSDNGPLCEPIAV